MTVMPRSTIVADGAPAPVGPYSHAAESEGALVFLSGQTPIDPATGALVTGDISEQARRVFDNLEAVLTGGRLSWADVVKVNVFLVDMADFEAMNAVYRSVFDAPYPARTTVAVAGLPLGARIEIELTASRRSG